MTTAATVSGGGRYCRRIEGADFSLQANTDDVPEVGHFYLLRNGVVLHKSKTLGSAEAAYKTLCREFWEDGLTSESVPARMASAWGLLSSDPEHVAATQVVQRDGSPTDCLRMEANARRQRAMEVRTTRAEAAKRR